MAWSEFDLEQGLWNVPEERMKKRREHIVPLPKQAIAMLNELKTYETNSDYLFPSRSDKVSLNLTLCLFSVE